VSSSSAREQHQELLLKKIGMSVVLAAGGRDDGNRELTTVEVFDVRDGDQWLSVTQLPVPCGLTTSAILHNNWYVITDSKQAMCAFLPELCTQTVSSPPLPRHPHDGSVSLTHCWKLPPPLL